jgi:hypothetical protein
VPPNAGRVTPCIIQWPAVSDPAPDEVAAQDEQDRPDDDEPESVEERASDDEPDPGKDEEQSAEQAGPRE